jgi:carboxyl-terminal processing protease
MADTFLRCGIASASRQILSCESLITIITLLSLAVAFAAGFYTNQLLNPPELELPVLSQARNILLNHAYYDPPADPALEYGMIHGMVGAMEDPYASFVEPPQHELDTDTFNGQFGGIGSQVTKSEDNQFILYPFDDSPAAQAGIESGAILLAVDGARLTPDMSLDTVVSLVRGPIGDKVELTIINPSSGYETVISVKRDSFTIPSVFWRKLEQNPEVGLLDVNIIASSTADEITKAVTEMQAENIKYFILDLRGNTGGLLESGIDIARLFLEDGEIISIQYKGQNAKKYNVQKAGPLTNIPLVVLIDHFTASASEIIAGALHTHDRAVLIGTPSYGKNTIQLVFTLEDSSSIHVTNGVWWLPGYEAGEAFLLQPDIPIEIEEGGQDSSFFNPALEYFSNFD